MAGFFDISPDPQMPQIPMPEAFHSLTAWTYSGNPYVSPALSVGAGLGSDAVPLAQDVIIVHPPPKYELFDTPGASQYILVPPNPPPTKDDPTGMKRMMEFLGIKQDLIKQALPQKPDGNSVKSPTPNQSVQPPKIPQLQPSGSTSLPPPRPQIKQF
jgi:hypothetical protein